MPHSKKKYTWSLPTVQDQNTGVYTKAYMDCDKQATNGTSTYMKLITPLDTCIANPTGVSTSENHQQPSPFSPRASTIFSLHQTLNKNLNLPPPKSNKNSLSPMEVTLNGYSVAAFANGETIVS
jgi:hypothetical protein